MKYYDKMYNIRVVYPSIHTSCVINNSVTSQTDKLTSENNQARLNTQKFNCISHVAMYGVGFSKHQVN